MQQACAEAYVLRAEIAVLTVIRVSRDVPVKVAAYAAGREQLLTEELKRVETAAGDQPAAQLAVTA